MHRRPPVIQTKLAKPAGERRSG